MKLFNVTNTSNDKPNSGISWIDALEKALGYRIPNKSSLVGAHMSRQPFRNSCYETEYIAAIPQDANMDDNLTAIDVDEDYVCEYSKVKRQ